MDYFQPYDVGLIETHADVGRGFAHRCIRIHFVAGQQRSIVELLDLLDDLGIRTRHPIVVTNWTNEEGTRFAPAMLASGVFAGVIDQVRKPAGVETVDRLAGDMLVHTLDNDTLIVQGGSFVACETGVEVDMGFEGFKNLFSGEGLFWLHLKGRGKVIVNSFGAIYPQEVDGEFIVDTGHIVAFTVTLNFSLSKAGGSWLHSILGGEGLVCHFEGQGKLYCQSHNPPSFGTLLGPKLKPR